MEISDNPGLRKDTSDPTLFCSAYKKNRFYMFTRREPDDMKGYAHSNVHSSVHYHKYILPLLVVVTVIEMYSMRSLQRKKLWQQHK